MSWFVHARLGHYLQNEAGSDGGQGDGGQQQQGEQGGSLLNQGATTDYIPEKYRVNGADGALDLAQSSRKLAEAYGSLEKRLGSGDAPPKTHDEYAPKIEVEGFNWDEFKADEASQSFLKGAHAKGLTNAQVEFVIGEYLKAAPGLIEGNAVLSQQEATTALREVWKTDQDMQKNVQASYRAVEAFANQGDGIGSLTNLMAKYGNDPDFVAFAANIGRELNEDKPVNAGNPATDQDFAVKTAELRQQLQDLPAHDPKRPGIQAQLDAMYASRYNQPASRLNTKAPA